MVFWLKPSLMMLLVRIKKKFFFVLVFLEIITLLGLKSLFSVVSVYAESSFFLDIKKIKIENCSIYVHIYPLNSIFRFDFGFTVRDPSNQEYFSLHSLHSFCVPGEYAESI
jgi:hypothetical protein